LQEILPLLQVQLQERRILFSEAWHLLKAYVASQVAGWETLEHGQQDQIILTTGTTFILEQLPLRLQWLAGPIAQATALRSVRLKTVPDLMALLARPIAEEVRRDLESHNGFLAFLRHLELPAGFAGRLNTWELRHYSPGGHWAIATPAGGRHALEGAPFTFLRALHQDPQGHRFYGVVDDLEADDVQGEKLTLAHLVNDHHAWLV
jgi:hypothetical protein